ncbi:hypothetical protein [Bradyrhizobium sp. CB3481]|uniref:hypothetical protein n=1 Tax=Bradyrhizobium sp. CB3481 TaxID=3039158 RepID=UPI0024B27778|nr:hypothetical protein [Bradyrhizobium sp. CB3481]WFU14336.1 hypothetical protein QA643_24360 [Bradyrhizobium sp. CB3481]
MESEQMGLAIQQFMQIAILAFQRTGGALISGVEQSSTWPEIEVSTIGLGPSRLANHEDLIVRFGDAQVGFPLSRTALRGLGEAMIALSTPKQKSN